MTQMPSYTISKRVRGVWAKFVNWYGADTVTKHFGPLPPEEWCEEIDAIATREAMTKILSDMRQKHPTWPPRFPEFELLARQATRPISAESGPSIPERLCDYVVATKTLTPEQLRQPWTYLCQRFDAVPLGQKYMVHNYGISVTGVVVPADGDHEGYRVMLSDLALEDAA